MPLRRLLAVFIALPFALAAHADELQLAVAANFTAPMQQIAAAFEQSSGHVLKLSYGSTGKFYAQIRAGAPFDLLLAADAEVPARLEAEGLGLAGSRRTYAIGRLVLWSATPGLVDAQGQVLASGRFAHLAIADPRLAPYGLAAQQTLHKLGRWDAVAARLVTGENIAQTYQFVATGNAELGFVALSQVIGNEGQPATGSMWRVPDDLHAPIRQDALILARARGSAAAQAFMRYLGSDAALAVIARYGYDTPDGRR